MWRGKYKKQSATGLSGKRKATQAAIEQRKKLKTGNEIKQKNIPDEGKDEQPQPEEKRRYPMRKRKSENTEGLKEKKSRKDITEEIVLGQEESEKEETTLDKESETEEIPDEESEKVETLDEDQDEYLDENLACLHKTEPVKDELSETSVPNIPDKSVETILEALDIKQFYPQKLKYEDVVTITSDVLSDVNKKPATLQELPWYFMKHVIRLDSDTREKAHVQPTKDEDEEHNKVEKKGELSLTDLPWYFMKNVLGFDYRGDATGHGSNGLAVHPLDLIYIVFLCADDFLRPALCEKMVKCQYAVPFILPSPLQQGKRQLKSLILHWALQGITRTYYHDQKIVTSTLVDVEAPLVTFMSTGEETSWKSKLMNEMLSQQQNTFWHEGLKGGDYEQKVSQGMVEVAWYLPGRHGDNMFPYPVTFANVRQTLNFDAVCEQLYEASSATCVLADDINDELVRFLESRDTLEKLVLIVLYKERAEERINQEFQELQERFKLGDHQVACKLASDSNFSTVHEQVKRSIQKSIRRSSGHSLSTFVSGAKETGHFEVDDEQSHNGRLAARKMLKEIDECNKQKPRSAKNEILRYQSDLKARQEIACLEKELCRQNKLKENTTVQKYGYQVKEKKWQLQENQLQIQISEAFKYFLQCPLRLKATDKKYFLQYLKLGLNERSVQQLQPLYDEYERCRLQEDNDERDQKLQELDEQLTHSSLGVEHFFRELAVVYDNIKALREKMGKYSGLDNILDELAGIMVDAIMTGTSIEIVDGDAATVPVAWLKAVFNKMEGSSTSTLFRVSVLGALSSGTSTLLNTTFGLNFPVSSGRCTRGAYLQLVRVDDTLKKTLNCDYVAVIDSEGLMTITNINGWYYDNELATFIIGLSDLTLVVIKGEGSEMQDVLPLAIHVFLKMNVIGEHQACHFVHQNMGAVDAMTKTATEIDAFVRDLNAKTLVAAKDVDQSDKYKRFADVLQYDATKDNTYAPGLWDGALPMGKTNSLYSKTMYQLKCNIITNVTDMQINKQKRIATFTDFTKRLEELWEAIKYENFVLSFKNVLAVEAHRKLTKVYDEEQWAIKRALRERIQQEEHKIENEIVGGQSKKKKVSEVVDASREKLLDWTMVKSTEIEVRILHYFQCLGCDECDREIRNRHLIADNEKEFEDEIRTLRRALNKEIDSTLDNLEVKLKTDECIYDMNRKMNDILKKKVQEAIQARRAENLSSNDIEEMFDSLWSDVTDDILRKVKIAKRDFNIEAAVQATIRKILGTDDHLYLMMLTRSKRNSSRKMNFIVNTGRKHLKLKGIVSNILSQIGKEDVKRIQNETERIITETRKYYLDETALNGKQFNPKYAELLFKDLLERIENVKDESVKITKEYKVDLFSHVGTLAIAGFKNMHDTYCKNSSPEVLLERKKRAYHDIFVIKMRQGEIAEEFCEKVLKNIILQNVDEKLSCTELLHDLRVHSGDMFRDVKSIQASIMMDLLNTTKLATNAENTVRKEEQFSNYIEYIREYEKCVKRKMDAESNDNFIRRNRYKIIMEVKLDHIINKILEAVDETVESSCDDQEFVRMFFSKIKDMKISHDDTAAYEELVVTNRKEFREIVQQQLWGTVKEDLTEVSNSWNIEEKLTEMALTDFLFKEVVGCNATCPFCKIPCDAHSGGKTQGNHSATLHRSEGLGSYKWVRTRKLVTRDCCSLVAAIQWN